MGGGGVISDMVQSIKMNDRRKKREHFKKVPGVKVKKTSYNVPTVSEYKRYLILQQILRKRRRLSWLGIVIAILGTLLTALFLIL